MNSYNIFKKHCPTVTPTTLYTVGALANKLEMGLNSVFKGFATHTRKTSSALWLK